MAKRRFEVQYTVCVGLEVDDSLIPDDEWRSVFYGDIHTLSDVAQHIAFNHAAHAVDDIRCLDGFADRDDGLVEFEFCDWEHEETREIKEPDDDRR